jgi:hypothetical protein
MQFQKKSAQSKLASDVLYHVTDISAFMSTGVTRSQVSLGRGLRRLVDMFYSARDLVEENDRRLELMATNEDIVFTAE